VGPRTGLDDVEKGKILSLPGLELLTSVVQPLATRYTDCAIPASSSSIARKIIQEERAAYSTSQEVGAVYISVGSEVLPAVVMRPSTFWAIMEI
jgi:hypothetical protein